MNEIKVEETNDIQAKVDSVVVVVETLKRRMKQMETQAEVPGMEGRVVDTVLKRLEELQCSRPQTQASSSNFGEYEMSFCCSRETST